MDEEEKKKDGDKVDAIVGIMGGDNVVEAAIPETEAQEIPAAAIVSEVSNTGEDEEPMSRTRCASCCKQKLKRYSNIHTD